MWRVAIIIAAFLIAPNFAPYDPIQTNPAKAFQPPSSQHVFGTDHLGRDVLSRTLYGGRTTLTISLAATFSCMGLGIIWVLAFASTTGASKPALRIVINTNDAIRSFPTLIITLTVLTLLRNNPITLTAALVLAQTPQLIHWTKERIDETKKLGHIESATVIGATQYRINKDHIYPFITPEISTQTLLIFQSILLNLSALTFLGLGLPAETAEWGIILREGREAFRIAPWISIAPGLCITILCATAIRHTQRKRSVTRK
jgi:ABC-type dipeptide/oligopeptide/nickel transport system permease subunit